MTACCCGSTLCGKASAGNFGTITIALTLMWVLFTLMLLLSWLVIRRMVRNMSVLQTSLEWQAWHDALTRLLNRGALFEQAMAVASDCQRSDGRWR